MFEKLPMNLQYFAEGNNTPESGAPEGAEQPKSEESKPEQTEPKAEKTFTQDEVNVMIQKRLDRALKDKESEIENARTEAAKLAKMNKDQKKDYELQQAQQQAQVAEAKLARYQLRDAARKQLVDAGYTPTDDDLNMIVTDKAETTQKNAETLLGMVERIKSSVRNDLLKGATPKGGGMPVKKQKPLSEMSLMERVKLRQEDPQKYSDLVNKSVF
ncbi:DUF4355 domain-containing protein [Limosilactobacillus vaginalis]|uniref:DUF4355 domain-containing protein n=1 Tax=Limosilactobacillus vaginalis TaxID=1633 RepID=A0ABT4K6L6_9LACO|nr:DUF4355 domain-containing protein [Limosilactobacillus vaginalis]MCZ3746559.1 DUF4355 domain-containing protein [Limosilactobacillus vaginalis]MCZ3751549.1 DUF4355 domain-containing protein [Limosilactobacillus vaginalis]MCZ3753235.1 DUF4355 domain-containing protein [Limosilactobacillus vaginalis]MCZ3755079.1 DUF4355 domain-containing protein [Limosilactobacillus vaginalis]MCZ3756721.1 DUF4355 domain-containing protein [Limosilactobacillus vaginalis]